MSSSKITPNKPFVVYMYGFPGAGKTAFARQLADNVSAVHLQQDRISNELFKATDKQAAANSRTIMDYMSRELLKAGISVVYDAELPRAVDRRALKERVRKSKAIPILVWLQIDRDSAFVRTQKRDRRKFDDHFAQDHTKTSFQEVLQAMQNPVDAEEYIVISGKHTFQTQKSAVFKKFYELGILTHDNMSHNIAKPELVNLVPKSPISNRNDVPRRNIYIR